MSIWASLDAPDDEDHEDGCAIYVNVSDDPSFQHLEFSGQPCDCGQPRAPIVYQGSNVIPTEDSERGGHVSIALIPPHVPFWRNNPDAPVHAEPDSSTHAVPPFLRLGVNSETLILDRAGVERVYASLGWWLEATKPPTERKLRRKGERD